MHCSIVCTLCSIEVLYTGTFITRYVMMVAMMRDPCGVLQCKYDCDATVHVLYPSIQPIGVEWCWFEWCPR